MTGETRGHSRLTRLHVLCHVLLFHTIVLLLFCSHFVSFVHSRLRAPFSLVSERKHTGFRIFLVPDSVGEFQNYHLPAKPAMTPPLALLCSRVIVVFLSHPDAFMSSFPASKNFPVENLCRNDGHHFLMQIFQANILTHKREPDVKVLTCTT